MSRTMEHGLSRRRLLLASAASLALAARPRAAHALERTFADLLGRRRMVRRFRDTPVPDATVERLLRAAMRAPSAGHTQPWAFVVVRERERRLALARAAAGQMFVAAAPVVIVVCADVPRARAKYGERGERYALVDAAFAAMCLLLAVTDEGLGACFVGAFRDREVVELLALPPHVQPIGIVPVGHPAESPPPLKLRAWKDAVHGERWERPAAPRRTP